MYIGTPNFKIVGENDNGSLLVTEKGIKVVCNNKNLTNPKNSLNPPGTVTIIPGVQIELGRTLAEFTQCLKLIRQPLAYQKIAESNGQGTWRIIRLPTGRVPEAIVCTINTINGLIVAVSFNPDLAYFKEYRQYQGLSVVHQLTAGHESDVNLLSRAVQGVSAITGEPPTRFKIKSNNTSIIVMTAIPKLERQYRFSFVKDKQ